MTLNDQLNPEKDVVGVYINYLQVSCFKIQDPLDNVRYQSDNYKHLIDKQTLIKYLEPTLDFKGRKMLIFTYYYHLLSVLATLIIFGIFMYLSFSGNDNILIINAYAVPITLFTCTILYFVYLALIRSIFSRELMKHIEVHKEQLSKRGIEFLYADGCCGKEFSTLVVRKIGAGELYREFDWKLYYQVNRFIHNVENYVRNN